MSRHTPGPWEYVGGYTPKVMKGETLLCVPSSPADAIGGRHLAELQANARLIAAAPTMVQALKDTLAELRRLNQHWDELGPRHIIGALVDLATESIIPALEESGNA